MTETDVTAPDDRGDRPDPTGDPGAEPARATLEMVAARAGVSRGTASRVLNGSSNVSAKAVDAVTRAARELRYRPNAMARSLVTGRTGLVGLVINIPVDRLFGDPFFALLLGGAEQVFAAADSALVLSVLTDDRELDRLLDLASGSLDGLLVVYGRGDEPLTRHLLGLGKPVVFAGRVQVPGRGISYVDCDATAASRTAVAHLVAKGRRRIATVAGPLDMAAGADRLAGWRLALADAGLPAPDDLVVHGDFTRVGGALAFRDLLARGVPFDAVFAANDLMAFGVYDEAARRGLRIPDDVAVVGFDDIPESALMDPPLTTVGQPVTEMGRRMAEVLVAAMSGEEQERHVLLDATLTVRSSCG